MNTDKSIKYTEYDLREKPYLSRTIMSSILDVKFKTPIYYEAKSGFIKEFTGLIYKVEDGKMKKYYPDGNMRGGPTIKSWKMGDPRNKKKDESDYIIIPFNNIKEVIIHPASS